jgi:hypothetical protein
MDTVDRVSVAVALEDLPGELDHWGFGYLLTASDDGRPHAVALIPVVADGVLRFEAGGRTCRNAAARPGVSIVFPPVTDDGFSLVVDGDATVDGDSVVVTPTSAVRHRPAPH